MVTNNIPLPGNAAPQLYIDARQVLPQLLPTMAAGDVLRLTVRQNGLNGQGLLYYKGHLLNASVPENLNPGDKLLAKVLTNGDQLLFQILDFQKSQLGKTSTSITATTTSFLAESLQSLFKEAAPTNIGSTKPFNISQNLKSLGIEQNIIQSLFTNISSTETLANPNTALQQLLASTEGAFSPTLREAANNIKSYVQQQNVIPLTPENRFLAALQLELATLIEGSIHNNGDSARQLQNIVNVLTSEIQTNKKATPKERQLLENTLNELHRASISPEAQNQHIEVALRQLMNATQNVATRALATLTPQAANELQQVATRLEQMANTLDTLNQLNPVMQAIGEPALILFPFLFQGLLHHSEVTVQPDGKRKKQQQGKKNKDGEGDGGNEDETPSEQRFHRIQVTVPLPHLGEIDVDIAHRDKEILVRFTAEDREKADFLLEQLQHLASILRQDGFEKAELQTHVGFKSESEASWSMNLSASRSVSA